MAMYAAAWSRSRTINAAFVLFAIAGVMLVIGHLLHPTIRGYEVQLGVGFAIAGLVGQIYATALEILRLSEADRMERVAFWAATVGFVAIILAVQAIERTSS